MKDNDDPIQEYTPFRHRTDNLTAEDGLNSNYVDNDLHDCSSDLSGRASVIEERMHEEFARKKRGLNKYDATTYAQRKVGKNATVKNNYNIASIFVFIIIIIMITVFSSVMELARLTTSLFSTFDEEYNSYDESRIKEKYDDFDYNETQKDNAISFDMYKENILITTYTSEKNKMFLAVENNNDSSYSNVKLQTSFYDSNDNIIYTSNTYINMLIGNNVQVFEISNVPEKYEKYEFEFVKGYTAKNNGIDKFDVALDIEETENEKQKEVTVTNFTNMELLFVEVAVSYLKNNELVKIETYKIPSLTSYEKVEKMVYLDYDKIEADSVYITLNDICI